MALSKDLITEFIKVNRDQVEEKKETTTYGTIVEYEGTKYVRLDGSDLLTPISFTTDAEPDERVTVIIKNHTAIVNGNISSPSVRGETVKDMETELNKTKQIVAEKANIGDLEATNAYIDKLESAQGDFVNLTTKGFEAVNAEITRLETEKLTAENADIKYATIENLNVTNQNVHNLTADYGEFVELTTKNFEATDASIKNLDAEKLTATEANLKYANIDFTNIGQAAMEYFYATSGLIQNVEIGDAKITGNLVGVTISGDLIEGNTIKAEKLVVRGEDGLYYKLNVNADGTMPEKVSEEELQNGLHGSHIIAKSITAEQVSVKDLVAFDATIGGFNITDNSIYSDVKTTVDNTTRGVYMDKDGQVAFGDETNFLKFYKDTEGNYKLAISAESIIFSSSNTSVGDAINEAQDTTNSNTDRLDKAESTITKLVNSISMLVRGENNESLMTQTEDGWMFSIAKILGKLEGAISDITDLQSASNNTNSMLETLNQSVTDLGEYTEYIKFGTDNGKPCIILGETDSEFKVLITNTDIRFMEGTSIPASISNQSLNIEKAVVKEELRQGNFVWMARKNGNYGLLWKGE